MKHSLSALLILALPALLASAEAPRPDGFGRVRRGMTVEEVKGILGAPAHISREILFRRYIEEWQYDEPAGWVEFNCVRGEQSYVLNSHADLNDR
jgi:hypothetical protein